MKQQPNEWEDLVEEAYWPHKREVVSISVARHSPLDARGIDRFLYFKIQSGHTRGDTIPFPMPLQVKASDNGQTVGVVLIPGCKLPKSIEDRLSSEMKNKLERHARTHPEVRFTLFVRTPGKHTDKEKVLEEIWTQTRAMMEFAKCYYRDAIAACFQS